MPKISIVVPIYNVERYLERCIKSLINQSFVDIEIILVNDGSKDNSGEICARYSKIDSRIVMINKENGGLSEARNFGILKAQGKYILFVDSDDYIEENTCELFLNAIDKRKNIDVVVGNAYLIKPNKYSKILHTNRNEKKIVKGSDFLFKELKKKTMNMAACFNLYKRSFILENNLFFKKGVLHEDEEFTPKVFLKANRVVPTDIVFYNYVIRDNSITTQNNKLTNVKSIFEIVASLEHVYSEINDLKLRRILQEHSVIILINAYKSIGKKVLIEEELIDTRFLWRNSNRIKSKIKTLIFSISLLLTR